MINFGFLYEQHMSKTIRWGIAGPGKIARSFADDLKLVSNAKLTAVGSRNYDRASGFAKEYNAPFAYGSYQELFTSQEVDVIYIATPHTSHAELSIAAMEQGKHVLCEKPLATNKQDVERMIAAARSNDVFLMEALWSRFNPTIRALLSHIDNGDIGEVKYLHADFAFYALDRSEQGRLLNPALAGGSILDIGIYPIFLAYLLLGKPEKVMAVSNFYKTGVEIQTSMIFSYESAQAILYSGLSSTSEMKAEISGTEGSIFLDPRWHQAQGYSVEKNGHTEHFDLPTLGKGYTYEIEEVQRCLTEGRKESELWTMDNSLDLISLMDQIREQANVVFPFEDGSETV